MPSQELQGGGNEFHKPANTIFTSPRAGYDRGYGVKETHPPLLSQLRHVRLICGSQQSPPQYCSMCDRVGMEDPLLDY